MAAMGGLLWNVAAKMAGLGQLTRTQITPTAIVSFVQDQFDMTGLSPVIAGMIAGKLCEMLPDDKVSLGTLLGPRVATLLPYASMRVAELTPDAIQAIGKVFDITISSEVATHLRQNLGRYAADPGQGLMDFIKSGGITRIVTNRPALKRGDLIRRCSHCGNLQIPEAGVV